MKKTKTEITSKPKNVSMTLINPYSAGIDISDKEHVVAVAEGLSGNRVRAFGTMTCDLDVLSGWLTECKVTTIAMESTGVYWKPLFSHLSLCWYEAPALSASYQQEIRSENIK
jgi:transposase